MNYCKNSNYCKYYRFVNYSIKKCFIFKDKIIALVNQDMITFDEFDEGSVDPDILLIVFDLFDNQILRLSLALFLLQKLMLTIHFL